MNQFKPVASRIFTRFALQGRAATAAATTHWQAVGCWGTAAGRVRWLPPKALMRWGGEGWPRAARSSRHRQDVYGGGMSGSSGRHAAAATAEIVQVGRGRTAACDNQRPSWAIDKQSCGGGRPWTAFSGHGRRSAVATGNFRSGGLVGCGRVRRAVDAVCDFGDRVVERRSRVACRGRHRLGRCGAMGRPLVDADAAAVQCDLAFADWCCEHQKDCTPRSPAPF